MLVLILFSVFCSDQWDEVSEPALDQLLCLLVWPRGMLAGFYNRPDSRFAPSQWETALLCNAVSHWLGASLQFALYYVGRVLLQAGF